MADRALDRIGVVEQDDVAFLYLSVVVAQEAVDKGAKLADDHLAASFGDQRKGVSLFADTRGQSCAE